MEGTAITFEKNGPVAEVLRATPFQEQLPNGDEEYVVVKLLATPVNPLDVMQVSGGYRGGNQVRLNGDDYFVAGNEGLYEVVKLTLDHYQQGNWVIPTLPGFGTWRLGAVVKIDRSSHLPFIVIDKQIGEQAARVIMINPPTAFALFHSVNWNKGEWLVQNAGTSQVSQYVAQLAAHHGVKVLSVVRDASSEARLKQRGATVVVSEKEYLLDGFDISKVTAAGVVRLALDLVGGATTGGLFRDLSDGGHFVTYGVISKQPITVSGQVLFAKSITATGFWLTKKLNGDPQWKIDTVHQCVELFAKGVFTPDTDVGLVSAGPDLLAAYQQAISQKGKQIVVFNN